jgi:hypothetical protein
MDEPVSSVRQTLQSSQQTVQRLKIEQMLRGQDAINPFGTIRNSDLAGGQETTNFNVSAYSQLSNIEN